VTAGATITLTIGAVVESLTADGRTYTVVTSGWNPGEQVSGTVDSGSVTLTAQTATTAGRATFTFTLPTTFAAGTHRLVLTGAQSGSIEKTFVTSSTGTLVQTGGNPSAGFLVAAVVALLVGGAGVALAQRARRRAL
jgi:hypothetical protein